MVDIIDLKKREGIGIWNHPDYEEIRDWILGTVDDCTGGFEFDVDAIVVFGSYGRGEAEMGRSDLDLVISVETELDGLGQITADAQEAYEDISPCLESNLTDSNIKRITDDSIHEIEVIVQATAFLGMTITGVMSAEGHEIYDLVEEEVKTAEWLDELEEKALA